MAEETKAATPPMDAQRWREKMISGDPRFDTILQFFEWGHLPSHLQEVSRPFCELANSVALTLPRNAERSVALRKLLEAKDAAVRALLSR